MCFDISLHSDVQVTTEAFPELQDRRTVQLDLTRLEDLAAFSFPPYHIIFRDRDSALNLGMMEWGVDYPKVKDDKKRRDLLTKSANARSERILDDEDSIWFRNKHHRCLIPVDGIFEHRNIDGWSKKVPYYVYRSSRGTFYIPGLFVYGTAVDSDGVVHEVADFSLITRPANELMRSIHNDGVNKHRMPLFVTAEMEKAWVGPDLSPSDMREILNYEIPSEDLDYHTVYTLRTPKARPEGGRKFDPWTWENLPPLGNDRPIPPQVSLF